MKLATTGNVVSIAETTAAKLTGERRIPNKLTATDFELPSNQRQFLSVLRANVEDAEQLAKNVEKRSTSEDENARRQDREQMLDFAYFGTLLGEVELKLSEGKSKFLEYGKNAVAGHLPLSSRAASLLSLATDRNLIEEKNEVKRNSQNSAVTESDTFRYLEKTSSPELEQSVGYPDLTLVQFEKVTHFQTDRAQVISAAHQESRTGVDSERGLDTDLHPDVIFRSKFKNEQKQSLVEDSSESSVSRGQLQETHPQTGDIEALGGVGIMAPNQVQLLPRSPALQIVDNISQSLQPADSAGSDVRQGEVKSIHFRLHPDILGEVNVQLKLSGAKLELTIHMEREDSLRVLELGEDELRLRLHDVGLEVDSFEVVVMPFTKDEAASLRPTIDTLTNAPQLQQERWGDQSRSSQQPFPGAVEQSNETKQESDDNVAAVSHDEVQRSLRSGIFL